MPPGRVCLVLDIGEQIDVIFIRVATLELEIMPFGGRRLATEPPKLVVTVGDCAEDGCVFKYSYAVSPKPPEIEGAVKHISLGVRRPPSRFFKL